jgi:hypothetical protein
MTTAPPRGTIGVPPGRVARPSAPARRPGRLAAAPSPTAGHPVSSRRSSELDGRVAMVTGAGRASTAVAAALAGSGAGVVLGAPDDLAVARAARRIEAAGGKALALAIDPADPQAAGRLAEEALRGFGRLDIAVNAPGRLRGLDDRAEPDCRAVYFAVRHQLPALAASGGGVIVNVALGLLGWSDDARCVVGLTRASALEHRDSGVRVNALAQPPTSPGYAATAVWLCSDAARHLNGAVVTGGDSDDASPLGGPPSGSEAA